MKIWNRFISFALATTLLLTVPLVSFAAGTKNSTSSDFTTVQSASGELLVRAYDLDNGDSVFEQYNDGKLVSRYTVDRSKNVINELVYSSDGTSKQLQRFIPAPKFAASRYAHAATPGSAAAGWRSRSAAWRRQRWSATGSRGYR